MIPKIIEEKKLWKQGYRVIACVDEVGRGCEKPDAEILTNNGWKFYDDINPKEDKVLSYANDGYIEWQKIERVVEKSFRGNLIALKNRGIDIVVTPDHYFTVLRRVFQRDKKDNNRLKLIEYKARKERKRVTDLLNNDFIPRGGIWKGVHKKFFTLVRVNPQKNPISSRINRNTKKLIDMESWVAFLGIFLAEGSTSYDEKNGSYKIVISQSKNASQQKYEKIDSLLRKLPFRFHKFPTGFICHSKQLYTYLKQLGKSYQKFIPREIKELPPNLLNVLIDWMIVGDGTCYAGKNRKGVCIYYTVSRRLKDDFEEILLKAGWTYHTTMRAPKEGMINGRIIKKGNRRPCFEIRLRRNIKAHVKSFHKKTVFYQGKVFCLQLSRHHNFYVRRNGSGYFTGNSLSGPVVAATVCLAPKLSLAKFNLAKLSFPRLRDSKKLSPKRREEIYKKVKKHSEIQWGIGIVSEKLIDKINIFQATKLAMQKAILGLEKKLKTANFPKNSYNTNPCYSRGLYYVDFLIVDGNMRLEKIQIPQKAIVKGDEKVFSCALASIMAKVTRDRMMVRYHKKYPQYGFHRHKGYGTPLHLRMLKKYGPCSIHRKTFAPVSNLTH